MTRYPLATLLLLTSSLLLLNSNSALAEDNEATMSPTLETPLDFEPYQFESQSGEVVEAELGTLWVPENREVEGRRIKLQFVRFASTAAEPGPPIVYLAGGPGGSGIDTARGRRFPLFMALRRHADVIAFDQRGTGLSNSIPPCDTEERYPNDAPLEREALLDLLARMSKECGSIWQRSGVDLDGYNTVESAYDLEDLRRGLGVPKITLWGISYGTHLAFATLRHFENSLDSVILASAEGPDETVKLPSRTQAFLEQLSARVQKDPKVSPLVPDLLTSMKTVFERLEENPVSITAAHPRTGAASKITIGKLDLQLLTGYLIKNPETQADIPLMYAALEAGDFSQVAPYVLMFRGYLTGLSGMSDAMDAASSLSSHRRTQILRERGSALLGDTLNFPVLPDWNFAKALGTSELPDSFRSPIRTKVPALFLSGSLDGRTYPRSHRELALGFSNASFVTIEGAGHDLFMVSEEVEDRILEFLSRGKSSEAPIVVSPHPFANLDTPTESEGSQ